MKSTIFLPSHVVCKNRLVARKIIATVNHAESSTYSREVRRWMCGENKASNLMINMLINFSMLGRRALTCSSV